MEPILVTLKDLDGDWLRVDNLGGQSAALFFEIGRAEDDPEAGHGLVVRLALPEVRDFAAVLIAYLKSHPDVKAVREADEAVTR